MGSTNLNDIPKKIHVMYQDVVYAAYLHDKKVCKCGENTNLFYVNFVAFYKDGKGDTWYAK